MNPYSASNPAKQITGIVLSVDQHGEHPARALHFDKFRTRVIAIGRKSGQAKDNVYVDDSHALFRCAVISRNHAKITFAESGNVYLTDLNSHHGTYILSPGNSIPRMIMPEVPTLIVDGDVVTFGKSVGKDRNQVRPVAVHVKFQYTDSMQPLARAPVSPASIDYICRPAQSAGSYGLFSPLYDSSSSDSDVEEIPAPSPAERQRWRSRLFNRALVPASNPLMPSSSSIDGRAIAPIQINLNTPSPSPPLSPDVHHALASLSALHCPELMDEDDDSDSSDSSFLSCQNRATGNVATSNAVRGESSDSHSSSTSDDSSRLSPAPAEDGAHTHASSEDQEVLEPAEQVAALDEVPASEPRAILGLTTSPYMLEQEEMQFNAQIKNLKDKLSSLQSCLAIGANNLDEPIPSASAANDTHACVVVEEATDEAGGAVASTGMAGAMEELYRQAEAGIAIELAAIRKARAEAEASALQLRTYTLTTAPSLKRKRSSFEEDSEVYEAPVNEIQATAPSAAPPSKRRKSAQIVSKIAQTTAIATVGAVITWSVLAFT